MVKGISRQVILVHSPDRKLFEQAIFILKEDAVEQGISDDQLLKEADRLIRSPGAVSRRGFSILWALAGAAVTGLVWLLTACVF